MGIHATVNVSHLAYQEVEPFEENHFDFDEFVIVEGHSVIATFGFGAQMWCEARTRFLRLFNVEKRQVRLIGRVFN